MKKTEGEINQSMRGEAMVMIGILKQISARGKVDETIEHIQEVVDSGEKIVVFCHHKEIARELIAAFPKAVSILGDNTHDERQMAIDGFQNNPAIQVIICSIKAAGVGITLTASSRVLFIELPWHSADVDQCEDRCHRIGQKGSVQVTYFIGDNTIDEYIYEIIQKKREIANAVTGNETEVETSIIDNLISLFSKS